MTEDICAGQLERFRPYLLVLARLRLDRSVQGKLDASDIVQQTLLSAHRQRQRFRGQSEAEMAGWLRQILAGVLADAVRLLRREKRDVRRECSLAAALDESSARLGAWLAAEQSTPSERAVREEQAVHLAEALAGLPEAQREALLLRYMEGLPLAEIAVRLRRSKTAVAGLLKRGLDQLACGILAIVIQPGRYGRFAVDCLLALAAWWVLIQTVHLVRSWRKPAGENLERAIPR